MDDDAAPFPAEPLAENRRGRLTADQVARFQRVVSGRRKGTRGLAVPVGAIGALLLIMSGPAATAITRHFVGWGFVAATALILAAPAFDPLAADIRSGRVETVEGAIGKRRTQSKGPPGRNTRYYLNVAGRQLQTYRSAYEAAPDAGYVRAYYLRRTRRLVNLERLPNPPLPSDPGEARDMFGHIARALITHDPVALARANAGGLMDAARELDTEPPDAPRGPVAGGLVREALVGKWTHPFVTVTLAEDGTATVTTMTGAAQSGHWSVDGHGRLLTDATGVMEPMDVMLDDGRLTIQLEGRRLTLTRATGGKV